MNRIETKVCVWVWFAIIAQIITLHVIFWLFNPTTEFQLQVISFFSSSPVYCLLMAMAFAMYRMKNNKK